MPCKLWTGAKTRGGYGVRRFQGKLHRVHRIVFFQAHGYWPNVCRHTCDTPGCFEVTHLLDGTMSDNLNDAWSRGRRTPPTGNTHRRGRGLNAGMPLQGDDPTEYQREKNRRKKAGTWVYKKREMA